MKTDCDKYDGDAHPHHRIQSSLEEVQYWKDLSESERGRTISIKASSTKVYSILKDVITTFQFIQTTIKPSKDDDDCDVDKKKQLNMPTNKAGDHHDSFDFLEKHWTDGSSIETVLYNIYQVVDEDSKNFIYTTQRMRHFIHIISIELCLKIRSLFPSQSNVIFDLDVFTMKTLISRSRTILLSYSTMLTRLTKIDFTLRNKDPWKQSFGFHSEKVQAFIKCVDTTYSVWATYHEIFGILSSEEKRGMDKVKFFAPFVDFDILSVVDDNDELMSNALNQFNHTFALFEKLIVKNIEEKVQKFSSSPHVLLSTFEKIPHILQRDGVKKKLFVLTSHVTKILKEIIHAIDDDIEGLCTCDNAVEGIFRCRQHERNVQKIQSGFKSFMGASTHNNDIGIHCDALLTKCRVVETKIFNSWLMVADDRLRTALNLLQEKGALIEQSDTRILRVVFQNDVAKLLDQERKFRLLGFNTITISQKVVIANKYFKLSQSLGKAIMVRNSIERQAAVEEREMMSELLEDFDCVVKNYCETNSSYYYKDLNGSITWKKNYECQKFVSNINKIANSLSLESKRVAGLYLKNSLSICRLFDSALITEKSSWLRYFQEVEANVSKQHVSKESKWGSYWGHQMLKAFEVTYVHNILNFDKVENDIRCDLVTNGIKIDVLPSVSEIRSVLYAQLEMFIEHPNKHKSSLVENRLLHYVPKLHQGLVSLLYVIIEKVVFDVKDLVYSLSQKLAFDFHVELYAKTYCKKAQDFESCFKWLKKQMSTVESIPEIKHVGGNLKVSLKNLKDMAIDKLLFSKESLLKLYESSTIDDFKIVENFICTTSILMTTEASTINEICCIEDKWENAKKQLCNIEQRAIIGHEKCLTFMRLLQSDSISIHTSFVDMKNEMELNKNKRWVSLIRDLNVFPTKLIKVKESAKITHHDSINQLKAKGKELNTRWEARQAAAGLCTAEELAVFVNECKHVMSRYDELKKNSIFFNVVELSLPQLENMDKDILIINQAHKVIKKFQDEVKDILQTRWKGFELVLMNNFVSRWRKKLVEHHAIPSFHNVINTLTNMEKSSNVLKYCCGHVYREEHWVELLHGILNFPIEKRIKNLTLGDFIAVSDKLLQSETFASIQLLQQRAQEEITLRETLDEVVIWFKTTTLTTVCHEYGNKSTFVMANLTEISNQINDQGEILLSLKESANCKVISDELTLYEAKILHLSQICETMKLAQRKWLHLEPIYDTAMVTTKREVFNTVDKKLRSILLQNKKAKIKDLIDDDINPKLKQCLDKCLVDLDECQHCLSVFLEEKRRVFPRFYFLGDDSLIDVLANSSKPASIQVYIKHLFQAIDGLVLNLSNQIVAFKSAHCEEIELCKSIQIDDSAVDEWLSKLTIEHSNSLLSSLVIQTRGDYESKKSEVSSQIECLYERIAFNTRVENVFSQNDDSFMMAKEDIHKKIMVLTSRTALKPLQQLKINAMLLQMIHHRDIIENLIKIHARFSSDWAWQSQLRFNCNDDSCSILTGDTTFLYSFEYQGNEEKLVHTTLTDKCYLNLTQALRLGLGGNLIGPAGTGKTETVKSLGALFGRQVLVFNCDDQLTCASIGRMFMGLIMSGAWGCFDEFNRLKADQLSAIADQIQAIQYGLKTRQKNVEIMKKCVQINHNAAIFTTMNPAGREYGGRSQLPSNLKALFRPVAMEMPDIYKIAEVALLSYGFCHSKLLGLKVIFIFKTAQKMLSKARHYDWGLRSVKSVIRKAGILRRERCRNDTIECSDILEKEKDILASVTKDNIIEKLTTKDKSLFLDLLRHTFQITVANKCSDSEIDITQALQSEEAFSEEMVEKALQLKNSLDQRTGCIILGDVNSGKSSLWKGLKRAMGSAGHCVETFSFNPKAIPRKNLFGKLDIDTGQWKDGVVTSLLRKALLNGEKVKTWLVCDGDIDPEWIETLNSVLDDNRLLTLPTGERLCLTHGVNFIFETRDLTYASPATISRNSVICMHKHDVAKAQPNENATVSLLQSWTENEEHFVLVGPAGVGRDHLIQTVVKRQIGMEVQTIYCNEDTRSEEVISVIKELCTLTPNGDSLRYKPIYSKSVLVMKNIECLGFDKYGSCALMAFFHHWFQYGGFYNDDTQFCYVSGIQIIFISTSIEIFTTRSSHVFECVKKYMKIALKSFPPVHGVVKTTTLQVAEGSIKNNVSIDDGPAFDLLTIKMLELLHTAGRYEPIEDCCQVPLHMINKWVDSYAKYDLCSCKKDEVFLYEARRNIEILFCDSMERKHIRDLIATVFEEYDMCFEPFLCFCPSSHYGFSLVTTATMRGLISDQISSSDIMGCIYVCDESLLAVSDIQHSLCTGTRNPLLMGKDSTNMKYLIHLACQMSSVQIVSFVATIPWDASKMLDQLQQIVIKAGIEKESWCIHVEDNLLVKDNMFTILSHVIALTETSLEGLLGPKYYKEFFSQKKEILSNLKEHLHVCITMEYSFEKIKSLFQKYPVLRRYTEIVFVENLGDTSLKTCIQSICNETFLKTDIQCRDSIVDSILKVHKLTRGTQTCSQNDLMELAEIWAQYYRVHDESITKKLKTFHIGVEKLDQANENVATLKLQSKQVEQSLINAQAEADDAMSKITSEMTLSNLKKKEMKELLSSVTKSSEECSARKEKIEKKIGEARPVLEGAKEAVKGIKRNHLNEIKSFKTPPQAICDVLSGVLVLLGIQDLSWNSMKAFLAKRGIVDEILQLDIEKVSELRMKKVKSLSRKKKESFEKSTISRVSTAAAPLAAWVIANIKYMAIFETVKPMTTELKNLQIGLDDCKSTLVECEGTIRDTDHRLNELKSQFAIKTKETESLKHQFELARKRSGSAEILLEQLSGEKSRWRLQANKMKKRKLILWSEVLLYSAYVTYLGDQTDNTRNELKIQWLAVLQKHCEIDEHFEMLQFHQTDERVWRDWGLHNDILSRENAAIISTGVYKKTPYVLDPNGVALSWLSNFASCGRQKPLSMIEASSPKLATEVEFCVRNGKSLVVKDCEDLIPFLFPLLRREISFTDSRNWITIGLKQINYNVSFTLFLISRKNHVDVPAGFVRIVNFSVTKDGLERRSLSLIMNTISPNLENKLNQLIEDGAIRVNEISQMEDTLLAMLCEVKGDLLENDELVAVLKSTQEKSAQMNSSLKEIDHAKTRIRKHYEEWHKTAKLVTTQFFTLNNFTVIDHFYRFSLSNFELVLNKALQSFTLQGNTQMSQSDLYRHILQTIALTFTSSIKSEDSVLYLLCMVKAGMDSHLWTQEKWDTFIEITHSYYEDAPISPLEYINENELRAFFNQYHPTVMERPLDIESWRKWASSGDPFSNSPAPNVSDEDLLLLIKILQPDAFRSSAIEYCCKKLGIQSTSTIPTTIYHHWDQSLKGLHLPIMLVTQKENDPESEVKNLSTMMNCKLSSFSFGARNHQIIKQLRVCANKGTWVLLKNLHLVDTDTLHRLETELEYIFDAEYNLTFRLWLLTKNVKTIPSSIIERCHKIVCDTKDGLKENVDQSLATLGVTIPHSNTRKAHDDATPIKLLILLAWTHGIFKQRRLYGQSGWRDEKVDFTTGDLIAARQLIETFHDRHNVNTIIHHLLINFIYGGKIGNKYDEKVLKTFIDNFFSEDYLGTCKIIPGFSIQQEVFNEQSHASCTNMVGTMDTHSLLGLPDNIIRTIESEMVSSIIKKLQKIQLQTNIAHGEDTRIGSNKIILSILQQWKKFIKNILPLHRFETLTGDAVNDPFLKYVQSEIILNKGLFHVVSASMTLLEKVICGEIKESKACHELIISLSDGVVPSSWKKLWNGGSSNATSWLTELMTKQHYFTSTFGEAFFDVCNSSSKPLHLCGFYDVSALTCALKLKVAVQSSIALDDLFIIAQFSDEQKYYNCTDETILALIRINGLLLRGCTATKATKDNMYQVGSVQKNMPNYQESPPIILAFIQKSDPQTTVARCDNEFEMISLPVYSHINSQEILFNVNVLCKYGTTQKWLLAGAALYVEER